MNPATVTAAWRDVIYKGNDNYYLEGTSDTRGRPAGGGTFGGSRRRLRHRARCRRTPGRISPSPTTATTLRLYVNGTQVASHRRAPARSPPRPTRSRSAATRIYGQYFSGLIDDVRVYNTALTPAQIQTDMTTAGRTAGARHDAAVGAGHADRDRDQQQPGRPQLGRSHRQRRCHRLPRRALPGRRLHQLRRRSRPPPHHQLQRHHRQLPAPATATASAPTTPPATSAPTPTPPPPRRPASTRRRRRRRAR